MPSGARQVNPAAAFPYTSRPESSQFPEIPLTRSLLSSTALVGQMTFVSRVLGLARDSAIAAVFGAGAATDAFVVAFRIPNLFRRLFAEGAFSQAFVPVLAGYRATADEAEVKRVIDAVSSALGLALLALVAVGVLAAPLVIHAVAPGFVAQPDKFELAVDLLQICFPYLLFISLTAMVGSVLNTYGKFGVPAFTPALLNVSFILATVWLAPRLAQPVMALGYAVVLGGALQLGVQLMAAHRIGLLPRFHLRPRHPAIRKILGLMAPALFGVSIAQINFLVDTFIASFLQAGSISWLYYADRLMEFPLGIFGVALGTVILPGLAAHHARQEDGLFSDTLDWALRAVLFITMPAAAGLALLAPLMISVLFERGAFGAHDVEMSSRALMAYAVGLTGFIMVKVLAPGYFAKEDVRTPVRIGLVAMLTNLVGCLAFSPWLDHAGLALATSLAALVNGFLLLKGLLDRGIYQPRRGWAVFLARLVVAVLAMTTALLLALREAGDWTSFGLAAKSGLLAGFVGGGAVVFALAAWVVGIRPGDMAQPKLGV